MQAALAVIGLVLVVGGALLVIKGLIPPPPPADDPVPKAQVRTDGGSPLRSGGTPAGATVGRVAQIVGGGGLVTIGVALLDAAQHVAEKAVPPGRPLRIRGNPALPEIERGGGWADDALPRVDHLSQVERGALAQTWLAAARMEHASIPAFAKLSLELAALGAPSELVEGAHRAALDEIRHARRCFALASAYQGAELSAGPIPELAGAVVSADVVRVAVDSLVDGCLNEGVAADLAAHGAREAEDPVIRESLAMIATDEERHAEVGWSVLAWCLRDRAARAAVAAQVERLSAEGDIAERRVEIVQARAAALLELTSHHRLCSRGRLPEDR